MTRRTLFQRMIAAAAGCVLAKTPLAGAAADTLQPGASVLPAKKILVTYRLRKDGNAPTLDRFHELLIKEVIENAKAMVDAEVQDAFWGPVSPNWSRKVEIVKA